MNTYSHPRYESIRSALLDGNHEVASDLLGERFMVAEVRQMVASVCDTLGRANEAGIKSRTTTTQVLQWMRAHKVELFHIQEAQSQERAA